MHDRGLSLALCVFAVFLRRAREEENSHLANLQREIMVNTKRYVRYQIVLAVVSIFLMVVQVR